MTKNLVIFLVVVLCSLTCSNHSSTVFLQNSYDVVHRRSQCDPAKAFPQMILIPYFETASQIVPNCRTYPVHQTALALFIFYHQWLEYFGDDNAAVRGMLEKVMIRWGTEKRFSKRGYDVSGKPFEDRNILGIIESDNMTWVWQGYDHKMSQSALFHELVHLAIRAKYGEHGDPDHEGSKYFGWTPMHTYMIIESKQMLRAFEL